MSTKSEATIGDLYRVPEHGKAEIVNGELVLVLVRVYRSTELQNPTIYHEGDVAEAEPALPGWSVTVAEIF
jgi:hypothetical protein